MASGGIRHFNRDLAGSLGITEPELEAAAQSKEEDLHRLEARCRNPRPESPPPEGITLTAMSKAMSTATSTEFPPTIPPVQLTGRAVLLVDDGAATGATLIAAAASVRARGARRITLAVPAAPAQVLKALRSHADAVVVLATPEPFLGVGACYREFPQVTDREVADLLLQRTGADREDTGAGTGGRGKP